MSEGISLTSKELVQKLTEDYYDELVHGPENGKIVCWASSIIPQEFLEAMDILVAYPENHAAAIAAKGGSIPLLEKAEEMGYSNDICSYARINLAYARLMDNDIQNLPRPDFVLAMTNICGELVKWYENLAREFDVPFILIDVPYNYDYEVSDNAIKYIKDQFKDLISQLEVICNKPFDYDKFQKVMEISRRAGKAWLTASSFTAYKPSPLNGFNLFNYMALIVCMRGREESVKLFELIAEEMKELMAKNESQFKGVQSHRILWEGIACWPYLGHNFKTLKNNEIIMTGSTYPDAWHIDYEQGDIDEMARMYSIRIDSASLDRQIDIRTEVAKNFKCDGAIFHVNRSCKVMSCMQAYMRKQISENAGIPIAVFDGDQSDPNNFSPAQFETRIQALAEAMANEEKE